MDKEIDLRQELVGIFSAIGFIVTNYDINYENVYYECIKLESLLKIVCGILNQSMPDPDYYNSTQEILQSYIDLWWYLDKNVIPQAR
jgi:hypothetical protein